MGNIWYQTYKQNETKGYLNVFTRGRFGFTLISFTSEIYQNFSIIVYTENNNLKVIQSNNYTFSSIFDQTLNLSVSLVTSKRIKTFGNAFSDLEFTIAFPIEYLDNNTKLMIGNLNFTNLGYNEYSKVEIDSKLPNLNEILIEKIFIMNYTPTYLFKFTNRIEYSQYWITIPYHLIIIISFLLIFIFHNHQPLKSKGYIPFLTCYIYLTNLVRPYLANLPLTYLINQNFCYLDSFLNSPNNISVIVIIFLNYNRFVFLQYINYRKGIVYKKNEREIMKWYLKLYKILNDPFCHIIYFVLLFIFICFLQFIVLIISKFQCNLLQILLSQIVISIAILTNTLLFFILFLIECYINFDKIKKCEIRKLFKSDPYYFKIELYLFGLFSGTPIYISYLIVNYTGTFDNIIDNTLLTVSFFNFFISLVVIPIIITIIKLIFKKKKVKDTQELKSILLGDEGYDIMYNACEMEYSLENLSCWLDIQEYYKEKSQADRKKKFEKLFILYLNGSSSEMELNLPSEIIDDIKKKSSEENYSDELVKELEHQVYKNLSDTFCHLEKNINLFNQEKS